MRLYSTSIALAGLFGSYFAACYAPNVHVQHESAIAKVNGGNDSTEFYDDSKRRQLGTSICTPHYHDHDAVARAVLKAKRQLDKQPIDVPMEDRLAVMILFSKGFTKSGRNNDRLKWLRCSLAKLRDNLLPNTTADIYLWTLNDEDDSIVIPSWLTAEEFPRVHVVEIEPSTWQIPCGLVDDSQWAVRSHFDVDYYLMGRWRLSFSPDFARAMGYEYHLQFDDDAILLSPLSIDVVEMSRRRNILMGVFPDLIGEVPQCTLGLPELTQYWMTIRGHEPKGELFAHVRPQNMDGVTSRGWDRLYHPGYFMMISLSFWFQNEVQDYLTAVFRSGRDVEGRWQEQAVMNMMRLVFVPRKRLWVMTQSDIGHDRHKAGNFQAWCKGIPEN